MEQKMILEEVRERAFTARYSYKACFIDRNEAKKLIMPYVDLVNKKSRETAKKYDMKPKLISFIGFCR